MKKRLAFAAVILGATVTASALLLCSTMTPSTATIFNDTGTDSTVYLAFGADSVALPNGPSWAFCTTTAKLNCSFSLAKHSSKELPIDGKYLNVTISYNAPVTCNTTKAELNINNPKWYDIADISLVDGYSNEVSIEVTDLNGHHPLGPPNGPSHNEKVYGLYPMGCDICVARQNPPCGMQPGTSGCKSGGQYNPDVPCQFQSATKHGGSRIRVTLLPGTPAAP